MGHSERRRKKLIEPRLQLRFSLIFLTSAALAALVQSITFSFLLMKIADRLPNDGLELKSRLIVAERIIGVQDRVKRLEGILPTCMYCKKIRDEQDQWVGIEAYITKRSQASFSHGVCPSCYEAVLKQEFTRLKSV